MSKHITYYTSQECRNNITDKASALHKQTLTLTNRLGFLIIGWGFVGLFYALSTNLTPFSAHILSESFIDRAVAFNPNGIWLYLSFFMFVPLGFLFSTPEKLIQFTRAMQMCAVICGAVFLILPTTLNYPSISTDNSGTYASLALLDFLSRYDTAKNCLPSLHAALTLLAAWAMYSRLNIVRSIVIMIWAALIIYSIIQIRRHLALDVGAGLLVGAGAIILAGRLHLPIVGARWLPKALRTVDENKQKGCVQ